jgi:hypothetical protein
MAEQEIEEFGEHAVPQDCLARWYERNGTGYIIIKSSRTEKPCGFMNLLAIKPAPLQRLISGEYKEVDLRPEDIYSPKYRRGNSLYIEAVVIVAKTRKEKGRILLRLLQEVRNLADFVCSVDGIVYIYALSATASGERWLRKLGFFSISPVARRDGMTMWRADAKRLEARIMILTSRMTRRGRRRLGDSTRILMPVSATIARFAAPKHAARPAVDPVNLSTNGPHNRPRPIALWFRAAKRGFRSARS